MKKYLSILCALAMLSGMTGCSSSKNESKKNSTNITGKEIDYTTLDTTWECDYLKLSVNSNWKIDHNTTANSVFETFEISNSENSPFIFLYINYSSQWEKLNESESIDNWNKLKTFSANDNGSNEDMYENCEIVNSFTKNGQAYIVIVEDDNSEQIRFNADKIYGYFSFKKEQEPLVIEMIDTIEFMPLS